MHGVDVFVCTYVLSFFVVSLSSWTFWLTITGPFQIEYKQLLSTSLRTSPSVGKRAEDFRTTVIYENLIQDFIKYDKVVCPLFKYISCFC